MFIDTHCHLTSDNYENLNEELKNNKQSVLIINGVDINTNIEAIKLSYENQNIYAAIGIHPEVADSCTEDDLTFLINNISNSKVISIGEIGLDYHWRKDNKDRQQFLFRKQIELALEHNLPIIVHSRDAIEDTYNILYEYYELNPNLKIVLHCYSSSKEMAKKFLKMNVMFGIGGVVTFKNEKKLKEVVKMLDMNRILLETDSPYLAPEPLRGTKNSPQNIPLIAKKIAEIKGISLEEVLDITTKNAIKQFDLHL